jgi:hypothetical protein
VDILRRCCLKFRQLFMDMTSSGEGDAGIDPFQQCITIASACNLVFRNKFLYQDTIGIIPAHGYRPEEKHSIKALQWIKHVAHVEGRRIQHARNGGEVTIRPVQGRRLLRDRHMRESGDGVSWRFLARLSKMLF